MYLRNNLPNCCAIFWRFLKLFAPPPPLLQAVNIFSWRFPIRAMRFLITIDLDVEGVTTLRVIHSYTQVSWRFLNIYSLWHSVRRFPGFPIYIHPPYTKTIFSPHASYKLTSHISYRAVFKSKKHISVHNTISIPFFEPPHTILPLNGVIGFAR